jgi:hypothetical protein
MQGVGSQQIVNRMIGAAKLDVATYEEVERDQSATTQAFIVVVLAAIAGGIGSLGDNGFAGFIGGILIAIVGWAAFSYIVFFVGTRFLATTQTEADAGQLLRTIGFASSILIVSVVGFIPILGPIVSFVAFIWFIVAAVVAVRQALEMSTGRAILTSVIAGIGYIIVAAIIGAIFGLSFG